MKRIAQIDPTRPLHRGFIAPCARCGLRVVHAKSTRLPFHMHRRSKLCRELSLQRQLAKLGLPTSERSRR